MPKRKASDPISDIMAAAEELRKKIAALPVELRDATKELSHAVLNVSGKRRGRPPGKARKRKAGRPRKRKTVRPNVSRQPQV